MTPELMFSALTAVVGAAFAFLLNDRKELKAVIKEMTATAAASNEKKERLADQVPALIEEIAALRRGLTP